MVDAMGICEKHELPLDRNGECELCRLSLMPSKSPPARSAWWALIIPLLLLGAGVLWALNAYETPTGVAPKRGVPETQQRAASPAPDANELDRLPQEPAAPEPEPSDARLAEPPIPPSDADAIDDIPLPSEQ